MTIISRRIVAAVTLMSMAALAESVPRVVDRILDTAPAGADVDIWRY
jgi:hypothetical protein